MDQASAMDALLGGAKAMTSRRRAGARFELARSPACLGDILVDIGAKSEGLIQARELEQLSEERRAELVVGQEISVYVVRTGGHDGEMLLSLACADEEHDWGEAERLLASQEPLYANVGGYNKGGLIVKLGNLRGFVPASQVSLSRRRRAEGSSRISAGARWLASRWWPRWSRSIGAATA